MNITKQALDQGFAEHKARYAGLKEDYFALLYLAQEFEKPIDRIAHQVAFGGNDSIDVAGAREPYERAWRRGNALRNVGLLVDVATGFGLRGICGRHWMPRG
jgi:hypothetical protein